MMKDTTAITRQQMELGDAMVVMGGHGCHFVTLTLTTPGEAVTKPVRAM